MNAKAKNLPASGGEHRIALVTGASGGLGAEMARSLATRGWTVLAASRSAKVLSLEEELARRIEPVRLDVTDKNSIAELAGTLKNRGLAIDLLVNNAGINASGVVEE